MITTLPCDQGKHDNCTGEGLISGRWHPPNQPEGPFRTEWITVHCDCHCHEVKRLRAALETLRQWDMLYLGPDGKSSVCEDAPWARAVIDKALG